jgi:hypothetical protein
MCICTKCKQELGESQFYKNKRAKNGFNSWCKLCCQKHNEKKKEEKVIYNKKYYQENKQEYSKSYKEYYEKHKEDLKIKTIEYHKNHRESRNIYSRNYHKSHLKETQKYRKDYYQDNKKEISIKRNEYTKKKRQIDINFRIFTNFRSRIRLAIKNNQKFGSTIELLGCSIEEFKKYIESKFEIGMTWGSYGKGENKWNIDHITPCSSFKHLDTLEEQKICFHYKNLQPLWQKDNLEKSNKLNWKKGE